MLMSRCPMAGDAGCGAEFEGIEEGYSVRELAVSCPCAAWADDGFVRDAGTCTSVNGESKGKSPGKDIGDVVLRLWNVLQSLQVVPIGSAACTAFIGSFFAAAACRRAAAFSGVFSVMVIEVAAVLMHQNELGGGFVTPGGSSALPSDRFSGCALRPVCRFLFDPGDLDSGLGWDCSGTSDLVHAIC